MTRVFTCSARRDRSRSSDRGHTRFSRRVFLRCVIVRASLHGTNTSDSDQRRRAGPRDKVRTPARSAILNLPTPGFGAYRPTTNASPPRWRRASSLCSRAREGRCLRAGPRLRRAGVGHGRLLDRHGRATPVCRSTHRRSLPSGQIVNGRCFENVATGPRVKRFGVCVDGIPALIVAWKFTYVPCLGSNRPSAHTRSSCSVNAPL